MAALKAGTYCLSILLEVTIANANVTLVIPLTVFAGSTFCHNFSNTTYPLD